MHHSCFVSFWLEVLVLFCCCFLFCFMSMQNNTYFNCMFYNLYAEKHALLFLTFMLISQLQVVQSIMFWLSYLFVMLHDCCYTYRRKQLHMGAHWFLSCLVSWIQSQKCPLNTLDRLSEHHLLKSRTPLCCADTECINLRRHVHLNVRGTGECQLRWMLSWLESLKSQFILI